MRPRSLGLLFILVGCVAFGVVGAASANTAISGKITKLADGTPVSGALVTIAGPHQAPLIETTAADGSFSVDPTGEGPYSVGVAATGYKSRALAGVTIGPLDPIALEPSTYTPLPIAGGSAFQVAADAHSGIFYASVSAPELYRTLDYGGSWQPVTGSWDDPSTGLGSSSANPIATSSVAGEIAVQSGFFNTVIFSTDYGLTWRKIGGDAVDEGWPSAINHELYWGHAAAGAPDVVVYAVQQGDGSWKVWRADMSAAAPAFKLEPSDPFGTSSTIAFADSKTGSFVGRVDSGGDLSFAPLTADGPISFGAAQVTGLPTPAQVLRLGGQKEPNGPPDGVLVAGGSALGEARMITKSNGASSFAGASSSATTPLVGPCLADRRAGSVTPDTTGTSGAGNVGSCWLQKSGSGAYLAISPTISEGSDFAYDAAYGNGNLVAINPQAAAGLRKFAKLDSGGIPVSEDKAAVAGTDPDSGGYSYSGITAPSVRDIAYGPNPSEFAVATFTNGIFASKNGGSTLTRIAPVPGWSTAVGWWHGASGDWLVGGHGANCSDMLTAVLDWDGSSTLSGLTVDGSSCADLGGPSSGYWSGPSSGGYITGSIEPVGGTDTVFFGMGIIGGGNHPGGNHIYRARLVPGNPPSLASVFKFDSSPVTTKYLARAMAYCPASSAYAGLRDVLLVATGFGYGGAADAVGSLLRISDATGSSPHVSVVDSLPHDRSLSALDNVRADCSGGVVYASGNSDSGNGLYKSVDGGTTFDQVAVPGVDQGEITAIGLNPADSNDVTIVAGAIGTEAHSTDGGQTWTVIYDGRVERPTPVMDIEFPPVAAPAKATASFLRSSGAAAIAAPATHPSRDLVGSSTGAFRTDLSAKSGIVSAMKSSGRLWFAYQMTTLGSDSNPALAASPSGAVVAVFRRTTGLYWTSESNGSWSIPRQVPRTKAADNLPAIAFDRSGRLDLAFARTGAGSGIYFMNRTKGGTWSVPHRVSSGAGDTLPAIAITGKVRATIAFLRTRGSRRIYFVSSRSGHWSRAARVPGSVAADAKPALGGPTLGVRSGVLELAFSRSGRGIYLATLSGSKWSAPKRLSTIAGDSQPSLAVVNSGQIHIVFSRTRGHGAHGLFDLKGNRSWSLRKIPRTAAADREASLSASGSTLLLAFARPLGKTAGIYYDRLSRAGWLAKPQRCDKRLKSGSPAVASNGSSNTIVFQRR